MALEVRAGVEQEPSSSSQGSQVNETSQKIEAPAESLYLADGHTAPWDARFALNATPDEKAAGESFREEYRQKARLKMATSDD